MSGEGEIVPSHLLSGVSKSVLEDHEPATSDSMLLLGNDLEESDDELIPEFDIRDQTDYSSSDTSESSENSDTTMSLIRRGRCRGRGRPRGRGRDRGRSSPGRSRGMGPRSKRKETEEWKWEANYNDDSSLSAPPDFGDAIGPSIDPQG